MLLMRRPGVTITLPPEVLEAAERDVAAGRAPSLTAWVVAAMEEKAHRETLKELHAPPRLDLAEC